MYSFWQKLTRPIMALAPMEDVTDSVFRRIVARTSRPDVFFTEFTSVDGLFSLGHDEVIHRFDYTEEERPIVAQVWGSDPELFYKAAQLIVGLKFDGMDINLGCPQRNVTSKGAGACLIEDRPRVGEIIIAAREGLKDHIPLSIKTRLGYKKNSDDWIPFLFAQKPDAIIIHGRTAAELSKVPAHWDEIGKAAAYPHGGIVLIGNGDVGSYAEALDKCSIYGVDGVMIGRGIFHDLWAFDKKGISHMDSRPELFRIMREHMMLFEKTGRNYSILKKFFKMYIQGFPHAGEVRELLMASASRTEAENILSDFG
jgi:tRNA-dihydrouridine synthase